MSSDRASYFLSFHIRDSTKGYSIQLQPTPYSKNLRLKLSNTFTICKKTSCYEWKEALYPDILTLIADMLKQKNVGHAEVGFENRLVLPNFFIPGIIFERVFLLKHIDETLVMCDQDKWAKTIKEVKVSAHYSIDKFPPGALIVRDVHNHLVMFFTPATQTIGICTTDYDKFISYLNLAFQHMFPLLVPIVVRFSKANPDSESDPEPELQEAVVNRLIGRCYNYSRDTTPVTICPVDS